MTLEQRVARLERSCLRWRMGCIAGAMLGVAACAAGNKPAASASNGELTHLTLTGLTVRNPAGGPSLNITADGARTSLQIINPADQTSAMMTVGNEGANLIMSRGLDKGRTSATLIADDTSGAISLRDISGKTKVLEP